MRQNIKKCQTFTRSGCSCRSKLSSDCLLLRKLNNLISDSVCFYYYHVKLKYKGTIWKLLNIRDFLKDFQEKQSVKTVSFTMTRSNLILKSTADRKMKHSFNPTILVLISQQPIQLLQPEQAWNMGSYFQLWLQGDFTPWVKLKNNNSPADLRQ